MARRRRARRGVRNADGAGVSSAFRKDVARSIARSLGRFLALAGIVALGCGFYAGLRMTAPDMKLSADLFYDGTALMDVRVLSTLGMTDADLQALSEVEGVDEVMGAYETDAMADIGDERYAVRVHSLSPSALESATDDGVHVASGDAGYLNRLVLLEGSWPQDEGECVLLGDVVMGTPVRVGDAVALGEGTQDVDEVLATRTYTVVGLVRSPYYATSSSLGTTSLGSGSIQQVMYVPEADFLDDFPYTEAFLTVEGAAGEAASSAAYDERVEAVKRAIEALAPEREQARADGLRADAQAQLDEARAEYERQSADAHAQLDDAAAQLDEAAATLAAGERELADGQAAHDAGAETLAQQKADAEARLSQAQAALAEAQGALDAQKPQLDAGAETLRAAWAQWERQAAELDAGWEAWHAQADALYAARDALRGAVDALNAQIEALQQENPADPQIAVLEQRRDAAAAQLRQFEQEHAADLAAAEASRAQLEQGERELAGGKAQLEAQQASFDAAQAAYQEGTAEVARQGEALRQAQAEAAAQLADAEAELAAAAAQLEDARARLDAGRADYEAGRAAYDEQRARAEAELADARRELDDAQRAIDDLGAPSWYVMDRTQNYGVASFEADADRVDSIASVFPFIFFLVAALVALTTMTRMVEEERVLVGTYKALGYARGRIASKYLVYAGAASLAGAVLGIGVLSQVLPAVIQTAYAIIYFVPQGPKPIDWGLAALAAGLGVGITLAATWAAVTATLRESPAQLMLPRAPKAGKRILLERVRPLWRRLSFSWKVTFRNLFRYKKRFVMTMVGIAGCTALLLTGLGLSDAINDIIEKQFGQITQYNATIVTDGDMDGEAAAQLDAALSDGRWVSASTRVMRANMVAGAGGDEVGVQAVVPQDARALQDFVLMRTRVGQQPIELGQDGVVLAEKLAAQLGVGVGDEVVVREQDAMGNATGPEHALVVTGVMENYIYNYLYVGPHAYEQAWGEAARFDAVFATVASDAGTRAEFGAALDGIDGVKTVTYNDETIETYSSMLASVNLVVVVLVVAAAALAFIVLYNLTNINITERAREIATLKVLGFTPREVDAYIYREIALLSLIGCVVGLALGVFMESFVVQTAEVDQVMFGREIHAASFALAFALTMAFTALVMVAMRRKLLRVDMVESLKSNE